MTDAGETTELIDDIALENVLRNAVEHVDSDVPVVSLCFPQAATPE